MASKLNPRQEQFKNNLLRGMGKQEAYEAVDGFTAKGKVAAAAASRLLTRDELVSGTVYQRPGGLGKFVLVHMESGEAPPEWGMLYVERHIDKNLTAPVFMHDDSGRYSFSEEELCNKFDLGSWEIRSERLEFCCVGGENSDSQ